MKFRRFVAALGFAAAVAQVAPAQAYTFGQLVGATKAPLVDMVTPIERRAETTSHVRQGPIVWAGETNYQPNLVQAKKLRAVSSALMFR